MIFNSQSEKETEKFAENFAKTLIPGDVVALFGEMGAGKTAFVRGFLRGFSFEGEVSSPTFAIVHEYHGGILPVFHFDMYRVESWDDLYSTAFFEYIDMGGISVIEWSENIENALPENSKRILIEKTGENQRKITYTEEKK